MSIEEFYEDRARKVDNIQDLKVFITKILGWSPCTSHFSLTTKHFLCLLLETPEFFKNAFNKCFVLEYLYFSFTYHRNMTLDTKGQLFSKWFFGIVDFLQKTIENKSHSSKNEFFHSFFGGNRWPQKPFRNELTFNYNANAVGDCSSTTLHDFGFFWQPVDIFYCMNVDKKWTFKTPYLPCLINVVSP